MTLASIATARDLRAALGEASPDDRIAAARELLVAAGYRVTRPRPRAVTAIEPRACVHCGSDVDLHPTRIGARKPRDRRTVAVCDSCYRNGSSAGPFPTRMRQLADPERYARLYRAWRHAHHRYHPTFRIGYSYQEYSAHPRYVAILRAMQAAAGQVVA